MTDDHPYSPSRGLSLAQPSLVAVEEALGEESVYATAEVDDDTFAVVGLATDSYARVAVVRIHATAPLTWIDLSRHEYWVDEHVRASAALAALLDERRDELPVQAATDVSVPTVVVPCENGIELLARELFDDPGRLIHENLRWKTLEQAVRW